MNFNPVLKYLVVVLFLFSFWQEAKALPAFARRENVSCNMCHTNSSAPHLNEFGYMYRRMAFHWPGKLGDEKSDENAMTVTNHSAVGVNVSYDYVDTTDNGGTKTLRANGINVPEVELWPLVGGFLGNFGIWSEIDSAPQTNTGGGVDLSMADIRAAFGVPEFFFNFRAGMMAPEGVGASDQWLDDGNIPLMDQLHPALNQDTFVTPFGAMELSELGFEAGLNIDHSHLTLGIYNGFTDVLADSQNNESQASSLQAATLKHNDKGMRDYRAQIDQFFGQYGVVTAGYYRGTLPLMIPPESSATQGWLDHFEQARLYLTAFAIPGTLDLFAGGAWMRNEYVSTSPTPDGTFLSRGNFVGANFYAGPHMTVGGRVDHFEYNASNIASGYSLQVSLPYQNYILIVHYNHADSSQSSDPLSQGATNDVGAVMRFIL